MDFIPRICQSLIRELHSLTSPQTLDLLTQIQETVLDLRRRINVHALLRRNLTSAQLTPDLEASRAKQYVQEYLEGLKLGVDLPATELQHSDDLAILAAQVYVNLWKLTEDDAPLYNAASLLEFGLTRSKHAWQMRLLLVRIYTLLGKCRFRNTGLMWLKCSIHLLGAPSLALEHYRGMNVKQVQNDTLSHFVLSRASTFSLAATGDLTYSSECIESSQIYMTNSQEVDFISILSVVSPIDLFVRPLISSFGHSHLRNIPR